MPVELNTPAAQTPVQNEAIIAWLRRAREAVLESPSAPLLSFDGIDAFEALTSELYLASLAILRRGSSTPNASLLHSTQRTLRGWAYHLKFRLMEIAARRYADFAAPVDVLLWPRDITHVAVLGPVARELETMGISRRFVACQPRSVRLLKDRGFQPIYTLASWPLAVRLARRDGRRRARALAHLPPWQLPNLGQIDGSTIEPALRNLITSLLPAVAVSVTNAREVLRRMQPRMLVVGNDLTLEGHVGCRVAALAHVPTAVFMHGAIAGNPMQSGHVADHVFVYGDIHRRTFMRHGLADSRIIVCGNPNMDGRAHQTGHVHPTVAARLGLRDDRPWILVTTSGPGNTISHKHHALRINYLTALARAHPLVPLVIKLHRKDRLEHYQSLLKCCKDLPVHVVPYGASNYPNDIFDWLQGCRLVLTGASTTAIEAMVMGAAVITMDFCGELRNIDFIEAKATLHVTDFQELEGAVKQVLSTGGVPDDVRAHVDAFLKDTFFALDGKSSQRAAGALRDLAYSARPSEI